MLWKEKAGNDITKITSHFYVHVFIKFHMIWASFEAFESNLSWLISLLWKIQINLTKKYIRQILYILLFTFLGGKVNIQFPESIFGSSQIGGISYWKWRVHQAAWQASILQFIQKMLKMAMKIYTRGFWK